MEAAALSTRCSPALSPGEWKQAQASMSQCVYWDTRKALRPLRDGSEEPQEGRVPAAQRGCERMMNAPS